MRGRAIGWCHKGRTASPCFDCDGHNETCHSTCEAYKEYEKIHAKERAEINKAKFEYNLGYGAPYRTDKEYENIRAQETQRKTKVFKQTRK